MATLVTVRPDVYKVGSIQYYTAETNRLGVGKNSNVFRGKYGSKILAIKIICTHSEAEERKYKKRLHHEKNHLDRCDSSNIIKFYGFEEIRSGNDVTLFMAWDLCQGSLEDVVKGTYKEDITLLGSTKNILSQVANGLKCMHVNNIIHCDLRPANIWISKPPRDTGDSPKIKITGFRFSRRTSGRTHREDEDISSEETIFDLEEKTIKTMAWMEPLANIYSFYKYLPRSDVFSFGLVCGYIESGGKHPFGETDEVRVQNLKDEKYYMGVYDGLDPCLLDLIERTICSDASSRLTISEIQDHPYFWTDKSSLDYVVSVRNDKLSDKSNNNATSALESGRNEVLNNGSWIDLLEPKLQAIAQHEKYKGTSLSHLIRFIRNKSEHYGELEADVKRLLGPKPEEGCPNQEENYFQYWAKKFPHLLIYTWRVMENKPRKNVQ